MLSLRTLTLTCFIAAMSVLTGCANIQPKIDAFEQQSKRLGVIYAQVNKVQTPDEWGYCDSSRTPRQTKQAVCQPNVNAVQLSWVTRGSAATILQGIPKNIMVQPGSIVMLDMQKPLVQNFVRVASLEETNTCQWAGKANDKIDGSFKTASKSAGGFLAGALMPIPSVIYLASSVGGTGGVICDGWNYEEAFKDKNLEAIFDTL
jgi:hypothetical protein